MVCLIIYIMLSKKDKEREVEQILAIICNKYMKVIYQTSIISIKKKQLGNN